MIHHYHSPQFLGDTRYFFHNCKPRRGLVHKVIIIIVDIEEVCYRPLDLASKTLRGNRIFLLDLQEQTLSIIQILAYY